MLVLLACEIDNELFFGDKILHVESDFRKLGSVAVLRSLIRMLRATVRVWRKLIRKWPRNTPNYGKNAKLHIAYRLRYRRKESGSWIRTMIRIWLKS